MEQECCPRFDPKPWDGKVLTWKDKPFVKASVFTLFFIPINFGQVISKVYGKVQEQGAATKDSLCLSDHTSKWNMDIYLDVKKPVSGLENVTLSGKYLSKVYEGDFRDTGKWCKDFDAYAKKKGLKVGKMYMWYTTCPKCAKKYGKNYVVIIAKV
ncbi:MAG: hydrolase [Candidatus Micrarchaeia archaeon]|jgi:hypothetical protein